MAVIMCVIVVVVVVVLVVVVVTMGVQHVARAGRGGVPVMRGLIVLMLMMLVLMMLMLMLMMIMATAVIVMVVPMGVTVIVIVIMAAATGVAMGVVMIMRMIVVMAVLAAMGFRRLIGAALRLEGGLHHLHLRPEAACHLFQHGIAGDADPVSQQLGRHVPVAQVPGEPGQVMRVARDQLGHRLLGGDHGHGAPVVEGEPVALLQTGRLG